ncbi:MAG: DUF4410 domain-containing protein [Candidatus Omnitrophota bacterium]
MTVRKDSGKYRSPFKWMAGCLLLAVFAGCASTEVTSETKYTGPKIARPKRILIDDFTSNLSDVPATSPLRSQLSAKTAPNSVESGEVGRKLGVQIASDLASEIQGMGLIATRSAKATPPRQGDIVIKGYFMTLDEGSAAQRMGLGFGSGNAELKVRVEGYQMTATGLKYLAGGEASADGAKTPGAAVGIAVAIATANPVGVIVGSSVKGAGEVTGKDTIEGEGRRIAKLVASKLRQAFERQGWI